jgi:hypothetical protein
MKEFEKHLAKNYPCVRVTSDDAEFARQNWRAALEWFKGVMDEIDKYDIPISGQEVLQKVLGDD